MKFHNYLATSKLLKLYIDLPSIISSYRHNRWSVAGGQILFYSTCFGRIFKLWDSLIGN